MCGIGGVVSRGASSEAIHGQLDRMLPHIRSRGPDGCGRLVAPGVGLIHTRLAIIDLSTGDQPIWNEDRTVACVFNGEIYNYRGLTENLRKRGHRFATQSDTEVLVHSYEAFGEDLTDHVQGMFAFAIWDAVKRRLVLGRDRLGIKPLYVAQTRERVAFASAIDAVLSAGISRDVDPVAVAEYMRFQKVPEPRTMYRDIRSLRPGHVAVADVGTGAWTERRYFSLTDTHPPSSSGDGGVAHARHAFERAVASHLVADVEVAAFLSGGIDSSLVVAQGQRLAGRPLRTFSVSFEGEAYDESPYAESVARTLGTIHETIKVTGVSSALVESAIAATQQPFANPSFLPLLRLCERAASRVKVVLTGDGGDEVGFGYPWYRWARMASYVPRRLGPAFGAAALRRLEVAATTSAHLGPLRRPARFLRGALLGDGAASDIWRYDLDWVEARALLKPDLRETLAEYIASPSEREWLGTLDDESALRRVDLAVLLRDEMLPKLDRAGMAFGLEGRVPLLEDEFVQAMLQVPTHVHMAGRRGKALLRRWAEELVPGIDVNRPKHGFDVPIMDWLDGGLRRDLERLVLAPERPAFVDPTVAGDVLRRARAGSKGAATSLYAMLVAELWQEMQDPHRRPLS